MSNDIGVDDRLDAFYSDLGSVDLQPLWTQVRNLLPATPKPEALPWLWQGETLRALAAPSARPHHDRAWRRTAGARPVEPRSRRRAVRDVDVVGRDPGPRCARERSRASAQRVRDQVRARGQRSVDDGRRRRVPHASRRPRAHPRLDLPRPHERRRRTDDLVRRPRPADHRRRSTPASSRTIPT